MGGHCGTGCSYFRGEEMGCCGLAWDVAATEPHCIISERCCSGSNGSARSRRQRDDSHMTFWRATLCDQACLQAHTGVRKDPRPHPPVVIGHGCCSPILRACSDGRWRVTTAKSPGKGPTTWLRDSEGGEPQRPARQAGKASGKRREPMGPRRRSGFTAGGGTLGPARERAGQRQALGAGDWPGWLERRVI